MIRPSALMVWPKNCDYPVARYNLNRFKEYFYTIWIALSDHHVPDQNFGNYIKAQLPFCNFVEVERTRPDWRDDAVNNILDKVGNVSHVCFLEQDFLIKDETFFEKVFKDDLPFIRYTEDKRIHPAFAVVRKSLVDKTSRDFSVSPPGDHFYKFFNELPFGVNVEDLGVTKKEDFYHMAGVSQNYRNFQYGEPFYKPVNFLYYNYKNMKFLYQHPFFYQLEAQIERTFGHSLIHTFLDNFFPKDE